jgi:hypothetical protein
MPHHLSVSVHAEEEDSPPASPSPSIPSQPDNTPERAVTPQLGRRTQPFPEDDEDSVVLHENDDTSVIDYSRVAETTPEGEAPVGFIYNDPDSRHFYPVFVTNPMYSRWDNEPRIVMAKYIKYSSDYIHVTGTSGTGGDERTLPVQIGRRARSYKHMTTEMWRDFRRGSNKEFAINEALANVGDPKLTGEINRLRGSLDLRDTLTSLLRDAQKRVGEIQTELVSVEHTLVGVKTRLEMANVHQELETVFRRSFPIPIPPRQSPERQPLTLRRQGPLEMPTLMEGERRKRCFRCKSTEHKVRQCTSTRKNTKCVRCGERSHRAQYCPTRHQSPKEEGEVSPYATAVDQEEMSLIDRISLLDRSEWTPTSCQKCGKVNPKHTELECPLYEQCKRCRGNGQYGYVRRHICYPVEDENRVELVDINECDYDLFWADNE